MSKCIFLMVEYKFYINLKNIFIQGHCCGAVDKVVAYGTGIPYKHEFYLAVPFLIQRPANNLGKKQKTVSPILMGDPDETPGLCLRTGTKLWPL